MKYTVYQLTNILGTIYKKDLKVISANSPEEAIEIYKATRPHIDRYHISVEVKNYNF